MVLVRLIRTLSTSKCFCRWHLARPQDGTQPILSYRICSNNFKPRLKTRPAFIWDWCYYLPVPTAREQEKIILTSPLAVSSDFSAIPQLRNVKKKAGLPVAKMHEHSLLPCGWLVTSLCNAYSAIPTAGTWRLFETWCLLTQEPGIPLASTCKRTSVYLEGTSIWANMVYYIMHTREG